jgi:cyanophycinase-like exopeptidase
LLKKSMSRNKTYLFTRQHPASGQSRLGTPFRLSLTLALSLLLSRSRAQNYTSYFTGNSTDIVTQPAGGICLMGGATEDDNAMKWFLARASGGDVLVLRASGSSGYNTYLYSELGVPVNSVETIVCNTAAASYDGYVLQKIKQAEAIWFAGGNQWNYVSYWRNTPVDSLLRLAVRQRNVVIGGTSAGMAIQGQYYFSARNGSVTSATALANPYQNSVTVDSAIFVGNSLLSNCITDTHFDNPDRKGRLVTFLARIYQDYGTLAQGIACDEYTAVCIDSSGTARVFGTYPASDDNAYFIQSNCELSNQAPENCSSGQPLTWNAGGLALKVYQVKGTPTGNNNFNLNTWQTANGGVWKNWSVSNGILAEQNGTAPACGPLPGEGSFISVRNGIWNVAATWQKNQIPNSATGVIVRHKVNLISDAACGSVRIEPGGHLQLNSGKTLDINN